ncbi:MAG TPA: BatA domain-containing protein [Bacteroidales bacterium]|nr:BatA domain-containing protein [Bacteroidales bacterium]HPS71045.1 BatA domain-containing protein [Bacteroidales bacterium]
MHFNYPHFLIAFFALLIPIFIHLFNFRKYRSEHFSNVKLLKDILLKTKKESRLKHYIVLILRILAISALVLAFAQPFIPNHNIKSQKGNLVSIFIDNSFSMEANSKNGSFLKEATDAAKKVVNEFSYNDDFILITHDFSAKQSQILNKDEILNEIEMIQISPKSQNFSDIWKFNKNIGSYSHKSNSLHYYISDFQKNFVDFSALKKDTSGYNFLIPIKTEDVSNVSIDSCWFLSPVFKLGYQVTLNVRIKNYSETEVVKLPVKLYINNVQKSLNAVDIKPQSYADCQLNYTVNSIGNQTAYIEIDDAPIHFDDRFYFVYNVTNNSSVVAISDNNSNRYLNALYGKDSLFVYHNLNLNQINYDLLKTANLVVLDQIKTLSTGLQDELQKYIQSGGHLLVFPAETIDLPSWNSFSKKNNIPEYQLLQSTSLKVNQLNIESIYFKGAVASDYKDFDMPAILKYYSIFNKSISGEPIMTLENGDPLLSVYDIGKGKVFLSSVAMNDNFGNAHKNALFFVPLHNIALMAQMQSKFYHIIGVDEQIVINKPNLGAEDVFTIKAMNSSVEFIPEMNNFGNEVALYFHSQVEKDGFYTVLQDEDTAAIAAFNFNRSESDLTYYSEEELEKISEDSYNKISLLDYQTKDFSKEVSEKLNGKPLWRWFIYLSLFFLLSEILVLRFWGKPIYRK